jgi:type II secretory pathway pseudopilin PulG
MEKQLQKGQVLLIVVLVMVVALTVGLSVASRSIISLRTVNDEENSQRAFSAAEAGIERAVKGSCLDTANPCEIQDSLSELNNNTKFETTFKTTAQPITGTEFLVKGGVQVKQDEGSDIWLSQYSLDPDEIYKNPWSGTLTVLWSDTSGNCAAAVKPAAMQVMVLQGVRTDLQNAKLTQYAFDPCTASRNNNFTLPTINNVETKIGAQKFYYGASITIPAGTPGLLMRVIPLYGNTIIGIKGNTSFPIQGQQIVSTGTSENTVRKITFTQSYATIPSEFFQYTMISP